jgi:kinesin family member C2/C3
VRDIRVTVEKDGVLMIKFEGVRGSPMVCGICIKKAPLSAGKELIFCAIYSCSGS